MLGRYESLVLHSDFSGIILEAEGYWTLMLCQDGFLTQPFSYVLEIQHSYSERVLDVSELL